MDQTKWIRRPLNWSIGSVVPNPKPSCSYRCVVPAESSSSDEDDAPKPRKLVKKPRVLAKRGRKVKHGYKIPVLRGLGGSDEEPDENPERKTAPSGSKKRRHPGKSGNGKTGKTDENVATWEQLQDVIYFLRDATLKLKKQATVLWHPSMSLAHRTSELKKQGLDNAGLERRLVELNDRLSNLKL